MTRLPPPEVKASWPAPNYIDPEERGPALMIVELVVLPLALICLGLRLYVRLAIVRKTWWDDWLMVMAAVFGTSVTVCVILATQLYGWNLHVWDLQTEQMVQGRQISIAAQTLFLIASGLVKLSILASYLRIAPIGSWFRRLTWATLGLVVSLVIVFLIVLWTQCIPIQYYWRVHPDSVTKCIAEWPPLAGQTISTIVADTIVYLLPLPTLWRLRLPLFQRISLMVLFSMGVVVVAAACARTYWAYHVTTQTFDVTWEGFELWIWTAVEVSLGIICGCVPVLRRLLPAKLSGSSYGNTARETAPGNGPRPPPTIGSGSTRKQQAGATTTVAMRDDTDSDDHDAYQMSDLSERAVTPVKEPPVGWMKIQDTWADGWEAKGGDQRV
ncbi:hypothetical protein B0T11DRAFT_277500 [Plectosphaerella cucumerina]|uniref:Rhodopsin domain-containing protein n=1 Tax=Plectosphaerella cucumerina TaxID=40658 RepID=A0A8K0X7K1_9PEZI|nr:hypothetical protein B0T11DRAFT_277500 [Plectosphaerella cucumerina]